MKVSLEFKSDGNVAFHLVAETEAEKSILAFMSEGINKRWKSDLNYTYRPGGVQKISLIVDESKPAEYAAYVNSRLGDMAQIVSPITDFSETL